jgi:threonine dehydrogenase-like Zn-dependent dehydrogenase
VKIQGCGICGSNIPVWEGRPWFQYPLENGSPGHEGWGVIESLGMGVNDIFVGERVTFLSGHAFSEYENVNSSDIVKLPPQLDSIPFPGEPFGCAINVFERCEIKKGDIIAVIGVGFLGAVLISLAATAGAHVIAISRRPFALRIAKEAGAADVIPMNDHNNVISTIKKLTNKELCDCVIEAAGHQVTLDLASDIIKERGKMVIAGYHQDGVRIVNMQQWNWKGIDVINAHEREPEMYLNGIKKAIDMVCRGIIIPEKFFTHKFPFASIQEGFELMEKRTDGFLKALVLM